MALWGTCLAGLVYVAIVAANFEAVRSTYGGLAIHGSMADVRSQMGAPDQKMLDGRRWLYHAPDRILTLTFDGHGQLVSLGCSAPVVRVDACPLIGKAGLGADEVQIAAELGAPAQVEDTPDGRILTYPASGYTFRLARHQLQSVLHEEAVGGMPYFTSLLRRLVP